MIENLIPLIALVVLPIMLLLSFAGCVGDDPELVAQKEAAEKKVAETEKEKQQQAAAQEAAKYHNVIQADPILVSYWRLDELETGDTTAHDSAPDAPQHGQYMNLLGISRGEKGALALPQDPNDKAAEFHGTSGYIEVPYHGLLNPVLSFSIELWVKPNGNPAEPQVVIGSYELDATGKVERGFVLDVIHGTNPRIRARVGSGTQPTALEADLGDGTEHGGWRHVVMTYHGATKALLLYVNADDGKPDAQLPTPTAPAPVAYKAIVDTTMPLRIAAGQFDGPAVPGTPALGSLGRFFSGRLDEVALYRDVLDGPSVRKHFLAAMT